MRLMVTMMITALETWQHDTREENNDSNIGNTEDEDDRDNNIETITCMTAIKEKKMLGSEKTRQISILKMKVTTMTLK